MNIHVDFCENDSALGAGFDNLQIITNGVPPEEVDERVAKAEARGIEAGRQAEYDRFWDAYQNNGNREHYVAAFAGTGWSADTFLPKHDVIPVNAYQMFYSFGYGSPVLDMVEHCKNNNIVLDFSNATNLNNAFQGASIKRLGVIDTTSCQSSAAMFANSTALETIDELILKADGSQSFGNGFVGMRALVNLKITGAIGQAFAIANSVNLSNESAQSIIEALKDLTGSAAQTLTFHNIVGTNLTDTQRATITAKNWALVY